MDKEAFWALIDCVNAEAKGSGQDNTLRLTLKKLMELSSSEIKEWNRILCEYSDMAYRKDLMEAYSAIVGRWSDDGFIDFRAWLISQGKEVYMAVIHDPDALARYDFDFNEVEFESYGHVAHYAYAQKAVLEQGGSTLLDKMYEEWWMSNAEKITAQFEDKPISEFEKEQCLERWFRSYLTIQYDIYETKEQKAMTFFEQQLRKIVGETYPGATFVGRACYVRLSDMNRAKIQFITTGISNHYDALRLTILNCREGDVDNLVLRFSDLLGKKMVSNPSFRDGVMPHIWDDHGKVDWYVYHPTSQDYQKLSNAVNNYLDIFMELEQTETQQWQQTMR